MTDINYIWTCKCGQIRDARKETLCEKCENTAPAGLIAIAGDWHKEQIITGIAGEDIPKGCAVEWNKEEKIVRKSEV